MANTAADVLIESLKNGGGGIKADVVLPSSGYLLVERANASFKLCIAR